MATAALAESYSSSSCYSKSSSTNPSSTSAATSSRGKQTTTNYYKLLRGVTEDGNWQPWLLYLLDGVKTTALQTSEKILAISALLDEFNERAKEELSIRVAKELIELLFVRPYCKIKFVIDAGIAKRVSATFTSFPRKASSLNRKSAPRSSLSTIACSVSSVSSVAEERL
jgi:hypothetical protein